MDFNILLIFLCLSLIFLTSSEQCSNTVNEYENYLGTKTPYRFVANFNSSEIKYDGCEPTKLWALIRHGTRNPSRGLIQIMRTRLVEIRDLILENFTQGTDQIRNVDLDLFRSWKMKIEDKDEKKLRHVGQEELLLLAERLQKRFPKLLPDIYSRSFYNFKYTASQRTRKSAEFFAAGLFGRNVAKEVYFPEPLPKDPILRFYKLCEKWTKEVKKNPDAKIEMKSFHNGEIMAKTIDAINERLGFKNELTLSDVHAMYMTCAFETAWHQGKRSAWCSPFSVDDFKVLEYGEDLKYYWVDGYGHELTYKQACRTVDDLVAFFENKEPYPKSTVYFTHSGTLLKMLARMGLYKEKTHLLAEDFDKNFNRNWRVSQIDSFGTNLIFVLFNCGGQNKVLTLHQEEIKKLPSCPKSDLCDLEVFVDYYRGNVQCNFDEMCDNFRK